MKSFNLTMVLVVMCVVIGLTMSSVIKVKQPVRSTVNDLEKLLKRKSEIAKRTTTCGNSSLVTSADVTIAEDTHNTLRSGEGAANMMQMTYSDALADRAQELANLCQWDHGLTEMCDGTGLGQNMYITSGSNDYPTLDMQSAIQSWFNEKSDYTFDDASCAVNKSCGHYTQVVWAESYEVGCGVAQCPQVMVDGAPWSNAVMLVCDYLPEGNVNGAQPYVKGTACTQCPWVSGYGWVCEDDLCATCDVASDSGCTCDYTSSCNGNGVFDATQCACTCNTGFYGDECQGSCACDDAAGYETACPQWVGLCPDASYTAFLTQYCKKTCNFCDTPAGAC